MIMSRPAEIRVLADQRVISKFNAANVVHINIVGNTGVGPHLEKCRAPNDRLGIHPSGPMKICAKHPKK
jgi:hypothetical protein